MKKFVKPVLIMAVKEINSQAEALVMMSVHAMYCNSVLLLGNMLY